MSDHNNQPASALGMLRRVRTLRLVGVAVVLLIVWASWPVSRPTNVHALRPERAAVSPERPAQYPQPGGGTSSIVPPVRASQQNGITTGLDMETWRQGVERERVFWDHMARTDGGQFREDWAFRKQARRGNPQYLVKELPRNQEVVRVLDAGAGPMTSLGTFWQGNENVKFELTCTDPLAPLYDIILAKVWCVIVVVLFPLAGNVCLLREPCSLCFRLRAATVCLHAVQGGTPPTHAVLHDGTSA